MTTLETPVDGVWLPLTEASVALGINVDTLRRQVRRGVVESKMQDRKYLVHVDQKHAESVPAPIVVVEEIEPTLRAMLDFLREREGKLEQKVDQLQAALARAHADLAVAQAALPDGKPWTPFGWFRQLWAAQA